MKERTSQDLTWNQQKVENRRRNEALFTGWDGACWRRGITARVLFRHIFNPPPHSAIERHPQEGGDFVV